MVSSRAADEALVKENEQLKLQVIVASMWVISINICLTISLSLSLSQPQLQCLLQCQQNQQQLGSALVAVSVRKGHAGCAPPCSVLTLHVPHCGSAGFFPVRGG